MAVMLRLSRYGVRGRPFYRLVASERLGKRDGKFIEALGTYDPNPKSPIIVMKEDRVRHWVEMGAQTSDVVRAIIKKKLPGLIEKRLEHKLKKIQAARKKRKAKAQGATKTKVAKKKSS